jgi:hypothetical protein
VEVDLDIRIWINSKHTFREQIWTATVGSVELKLLLSFKDPTYPSKFSLRYGCMLIMPVQVFLAGLNSPMLLN